MKQVYCIALLLLIASGCGNADSSQKPGNETDNATKSGGTPGDFYKRMSGKIAGKDVVVQLHKFGHVVEGYYQYTGIDKPIMLTNYADTMADNIDFLTEVDLECNTDDTARAHWELELKGENATGKWVGGDGKTTNNIELKEQYPEGSIRLDAYYHTDTAQLFRTLAYPRSYVTYGVVFPKKDAAKEMGVFLRSTISFHMTLEGGGDVTQGLQTRAWRYFGNYRLDLKGLVDSTAPEDELQSSSYQYSTSFQHKVLYNDNNWLILEDAVAQYTGGAHGIYGSTYQNLDISASRAWDLSMIVADTNSLKPYLQAAARQHFKIANNEPLGSRLLVDEVPVTTNMYLTPGGLTFVYQPYEIASYADGMVQIFIPYDQILPLLTPEFIKRQGLEANGGVAMRGTTYFYAPQLFLKS